MGLDMFLTKDIYFYTWNDGAEEELAKLMGPDLLKKIGAAAKEVKSIRVEAGYWRKANQIHGWFVQNVQDGDDNCAEYYVSTEKLKELYETVCSALETKEKPDQEEILEELGLEPTSGFFFGSSVIDEYYWQDLEQTKEILEPILKETEERNKEYEEHMTLAKKCKEEGKPLPEQKGLALGISYYYQSSW
jgi:hypothetical protein